MKKWFRRRIHISWHIACTSLGVIIGAALSPMITSLQIDAAWLVIAFSLLFVVAIKRVATFVLLSLAAGLLIGVWRGTIERQGLTQYQPYIDQVVMLSGLATEDTSYGPRGDQRMHLGNVQINQQGLPAEVWISTPSTLEIKRGDTVTVAGRLNKGFGNLPAAMYRAQIVSVERPHPGDVARQVRDWFADGVRRAVPEPAASLGIGYLTGAHSILPESLEQQLRIVGLTHAIVASGYNLTILVSITRSLFARISKYLATLSAGILISSFMLMTGMNPSMSRAGLVSGLSLLAWYYGRVIHPLVLLPFAAAVTVLLNPAYVWGDIGWYLSFAAFAGVIVLAPLIHHFFWGTKKRPGIFREIVVGTLAAQFTTLPIILFTFGKYSVYALPANILVLPLVPLTMLLTFLSGVAGLVVTTAAPWFGTPATAILHYMTAVVGFISGLPGAQSEINFGWPSLVISYVVLVAVIIYLWRVTRHCFRIEDKNSF